MNSKTFQIADFSIAAAAEQRPCWTLDMNALRRLEQCCKALDYILESGDYEVRVAVPVDGDDAGSCCVELVTTDSGKPICSTTVNRLFIPDKQS